jgi:SAM-dependent methyltransferase
MRISSLFFLAAVLLLTTPGCFDDAPWKQSREEMAVDSLYSTDVPYVATPQKVVEKMLEVAAVNEDDVVYDLGSGDGRIVLTAAQRYGARGVGVELVPELVREARDHARLAGVSDRVTFRREDLFETDLGEATVVTLYLLPEVNRKLQPKLLRELDPGDRVVAHNYPIGDWSPDSTLQVGDHRVFFWRVPETVPDSLLNGEGSK